MFLLSFFFFFVLCDSVSLFVALLFSTRDRNRNVETVRLKLADSLFANVKFKSAGFIILTLTQVGHFLLQFHFISFLASQRVNKKHAYSPDDNDSLSFKHLLQIKCAMLSWQRFCNFAATMPMFCILCNKKKHHNYFSKYNYMLVAIAYYYCWMCVCVDAFFFLFERRTYYCQFEFSLMALQPALFRYTRSRSLSCTGKNQPSGKVSCTIFPLNFSLLHVDLKIRAQLERTCSNLRKAKKNKIHQST